MKKKDLFVLNSALQSVSMLKGVKFAYAIAKNARLIEPDIEIILSLKEEYDKEKNELLIKMSKKDKDGNPMGEYLPDGRFNYQVENKTEYEKELKKLDEKYKKEKDEYDKLLEEEIKIDLHKIKQADVPQDITAAQLEGIFDIIE